MDTRRSALPRFMIPVFFASWLAVPGFSALPLSRQLAELQERNDDRLAAMRTVSIRETICERRKIDDAMLSQLRRERVEAILNQRELDIQRHTERGGQPGQISHAHALANSRLEMVDENLLLTRLNADTMMRRDTTIDSMGRRIRRDDLDGRDVDTLVRKNGLSKSQRQSLDKSGSAIMNGDLPEARLHPNVGKLATLMPYRTIQWDLEFLRLGVVPHRVFSDAVAVDFRTNPDGTHDLLVRNKATKTLELEVTVSPRWGHAVTRCVAYEGDTLLEEFTASDFREIDGIFFPLKTKSVTHSPVTSFLTVEREIQGLTLNQPIKNADALFSIPKDYPVQDLSKP